MTLDGHRLSRLNEERKSKCSPLSAYQHLCGEGRRALICARPLTIVLLNDIEIIYT